MGGCGTNSLWILRNHRVLQLLDLVCERHQGLNWGLLPGCTQTRSAIVSLLRDKQLEAHSQDVAEPEFEPGLYELALLSAMGSRMPWLLTEQRRYCRAFSQAQDSRDAFTYPLSPTLLLAAPQPFWLSVFGSLHSSSLFLVQNSHTIHLPSAFARPMPTWSLSLSLQVTSQAGHLPTLIENQTLQYPLSSSLFFAAAAFVTTWTCVAMDWFVECQSSPWHWEISVIGVQGPGFALST
jgi:hypothetical protein